ncbi:hypothetical protein BO85DRAFT_83157 [Aspergillus piperis CBS 112811]|uniref:Uncharacterized protein n=1 Tax=Aspergillus piperis CBS 112811 TaxID=1448313 RepID=A0A8G1QZ88_9EURO|nr:hypothetical protein BO85DRAFT_83157 [Aspergillus piperis CBS 112811]RAH55334.1 hypothetical protein BO85DRAFT_83157 [Aspergillus piperis CBS 112811]
MKVEKHCLLPSILLGRYNDQTSAKYRVHILPNARYHALQCDNIYQPRPSMQSNRKNKYEQKDDGMVEMTPAEKKQKQERGIRK